MTLVTRNGRVLNIGSLYRFHAIPGSDHGWMDGRACRLVAAETHLDNHREWMIVEFPGATDAMLMSMRGPEEHPLGTWPALEYQLEIMQ